MSWGSEAPEGLGLLQEPQRLCMAWRFPCARPVRSVLIRLPPSAMAAGALQLACAAAAGQQEQCSVHFFLEAIGDEPLDADDSAAGQSTLLTVQVRGAVCSPCASPPSPVGAASLQHDQHLQRYWVALHAWEDWRGGP